MNWLNQLVKQQLVRPIDAEFGRFIATQQGGIKGAIIDESLLLLVVLVSVELGKKNACLDLAQLDVIDYNMGKFDDDESLEESKVSVVTDPKNTWSDWWEQKQN